MLVLVVDIETAGLPKFRPNGGRSRFFAPLTLSAFESSRLIELAWQLYTWDGRLLHEYSELVRPVAPRCFKFDRAASKVHKIPLKDVLNAEVSTATALRELRQILRATAHEGVVMVGHNIEYDWHVLASEAHRLNDLRTRVMLDCVQLHCTMHAGTRFCGLKRSGGKPKWPKLDELVRACDAYVGKSDDRPQHPRHSALGDVQRTARCFFILQMVGQMVATTGPPHALVRSHPRCADTR